jgi:hypothetical protein
VHHLLHKYHVLQQSVIAFLFTGFVSSENRVGVTGRTLVCFSGLSNFPLGTSWQTKAEYETYNICRCFYRGCGGLKTGVDGTIIKIYKKRVKMRSGLNWLRIKSSVALLQT